MIKYSYFPGCTLKNKAIQLDKYARASAKMLGVELEEIKDWQCCGGVYTLNKDKIATRLASVRALKWAKDNNLGLVTLCSACHNVIKQVNNDMKNDEYVSSRVIAYTGEEYHGETEVIHFLELLRDKIGFDVIKEKVVNPVNAKIGAYYGCLLLRPNKVMQMDNPENPTILEDFIRAIGGEPVIYAERNECCGAYATLEDQDIATKRSNDVLSNAKNNGAEMLVTACPLCMYNLNKHAKDVKVVYFTELLAKALGVTEALDE
jgi:heterodisulfide reductase subunit B